jgi:hypothetical protein
MSQVFVFLILHNAPHKSLVACNKIAFLELWHSQSHILICFTVEASRWLPFDAEADASAPPADDIDEDDAADDACFMMADTIRLLLHPRTRLFRAASLAGEPVQRIGVMLFICCA